MYFHWCPTLPLQIWITDETGEENFGVAPALKTAAWADPHSIEIAIGQRQHQMAELMADTRARHAESEISRRAAENVNRALITAGKEAVRLREPVFNNSGAADVLALSSGAAVTETAQETEEEESFLDRMNRL